MASVLGFAYPDPSMDVERITTYWRCEPCGETVTLWLDLAIDGDLDASQSPSDLVTVTGASCPVCDSPLRRVVSPGDLRSLEQLVGEDSS